MTLSHAFTSVTRWLLVVIGCAVLATAQPMSSTSAPAAPEPAENSKRSGDTIIYPKPGAESSKTASDGERDSSRSFIVVIALLLAAGGAWILMQRRKAGPIGGRGRKLQIDETRPLGNRQYLVVADYDGKKFLLGVTPGQIQMLAPLESASPSATDKEEK